MKKRLGKKIQRKLLKLLALLLCIIVSNLVGLLPDSKWVVIAQCVVYAIMLGLILNLLALLRNDKEKEE